MLEGSQIHNLYKGQVVLSFWDCWSETLDDEINNVCNSEHELYLLRTIVFNMIMLKQES